MFTCLLATGVDLALYCNGSRNFKLQHLQAAFSVSGFFGEHNMTANGPRRCMIFQATSFIPTSNVASARQGGRALTTRNVQYRTQILSPNSGAGALE